MNFCIRQFIRAAACEYVFKMIQDYSHCASCFISGSEHYIHCGSKRLVEAMLKDVKQIDAEDES